MNLLLILRGKLDKALEEMRKLTENAEAEDRDFNAEEQEAWDALEKDAESLRKRVQRLEQQEAQAAQLQRSAGTLAGRPQPQQQPPNPNIGMSQRDLRNYSIVRAIRAIANRDWSGAELEREASQSVAQRIGREPQGFFVPYDWMRSAPNGEQRDLNVGTATAGGNLVATDLLAQSFIELLRNRVVVRQAGATMLTGLVGDVAIPRQTGGATSYWLAESGAPTESQQTVDQVALSPKTVGAFTDYSRKLMQQSSIDVEMFVRDDLATVLALAIDLAALHGTGASNQPTGIAATSGIGSVVGGTNGAAPDWADIIDLETAVAVDNADVGRLAYITNAAVRGKLKQTEKASGTAQFVWDDNSSPVNGYTAHVSNQVRSDLDKGTSTGVCSAIFFGNWADLIMAMWGSLDILVDPYTHSTSGTMRIVALQDVDIAVRHAQSFAAMLDALTA